ncbi:MAG: XTP/dITP diphosphatase [Phycisphaerales bacterium]|nr:XTP/dITP diphosphatase [Phycisphaerales bacterium]
MKILIATSNAGKAAEFRHMLKHDRLDWIDLSQLDPAPPVEETGQTFLDNANLKAAAYARHYGLWTLADDSGLEVEALNGQPGVYSARWALRHSAGQGDAANNALLLKQLADVPDEQRNARFVCALSLARPSGEIVVATHNNIEGRILRAPKGKNGFGYDPLFYIESLARTAAELSPDEKHAISHRGKALRAMKRLMDQTDWLTEQ